MADRQVVLWTPQPPDMVVEPHDEPGPDPFSPIDVVELDDPLPSNAAKFVCVRPGWSGLDLEIAYSHLLYPGERPEILMRDIAFPRFEQFVLAAEFSLKHIESKSDRSLQEVINEAGYGEWMTVPDVELILVWLAARSDELDVDMGYSVPEGYQGEVLNQPQLDGISRQTAAVTDSSRDQGQQRQVDLEIGDLFIGDEAGRTVGQAILLSDSESDTKIKTGNVHISPRKRRADSSSQPPPVIESPTKKRKVHVKEESDDEDEDDDRVYAPSPSPARSPSLPVTPSPPAPNRSASPARRTRCTAAQQFAMVSCLYTAGYESGDYGTIAQRVNSANPQGLAKSKTRVKSAMRETHWSGFVKANGDGQFAGDQLIMSMPDMSGPVTSEKSWTSEQKRVVWAETMSTGEHVVKWTDVARAVNDAAAEDQSLYRKPLDCEKTWRDTLRRHFGLQGRVKR